MHCSMSDEYVSKAMNNRSSGFAQPVNEVLQDIQASFNISPTYGVPTEDIFTIRYQYDAHTQDPQSLFLKDPLTGSGRFLDAPQRIFVVSDSEWRASQYLTGHPGRRGISSYDTAAILLHENGDNRNSWCRKTLIHEILHSVSLYSRIWDRFPNIMRLRRFFREGITECLTGYILLKRHKECYEEWKTNKLFRCTISYQQHVRTWCSFCQCVGIKDLAKFYLSTQENPVEAWQQLVQSVHAKSFKKFNYQLNPNSAFREPQFRQICINSFPDFKAIYLSLSKCLDFSRIP